MERLSSYISVHPFQIAGSCLLVGALMPLAFSPLSLFPLAILLPGWLFLCWLNATPARAFWYGWSFGLGMFAHGVYWVYHSMHIFGHMPVPLAMFFTLLLAAFLALYPGLAGWLANRWCALPNAVRVVWVYPTLWVLMEWVRSWFLTGFPWLNLGYSQTETWLAGLAPYVGVYGVSWAVVLSAGLLVWAVLARSTMRIRPLLAVLLLWLVVYAGGRVEWSEPAGDNIRVSLVQGNVAQASKWNPSRQREIIDHYLTQTEQHWDSDLVVWPETAVPAFYHTMEKSLMPALERMARETQTDLLLGMPVMAENQENYYNSMISIGEARGFYFKRHLVPFGEYVPLRSWLQDMLDILKVPMAAFIPGDAEQPPLMLAGYAAAISICYEVAFGEEVITSLPQANFLINVSNNAWFGDSSAPRQQLQMARMRAQETGRYMVSATNDGITAIVNHRGEIEQIAPQFQTYVLTGNIQPRRGATPYVRMGNYPVVMALLLLLGGMIFMVRRSQSRAL